MDGIAPVATRPRRLRRRVCDCNDDAAGVRRVSRHTDRHHRDQRPDHRAVARLRAVARGRGVRLPRRPVPRPRRQECARRVRVRRGRVLPQASQSVRALPHRALAIRGGPLPDRPRHRVPRVAPSDRTARRGGRGHGRGVRGLGHRADARDEPSRPRSRRRRRRTPGSSAPRSPTTPTSASRPRSRSSSARRSGAGGGTSRGCSSGRWSCSGSSRAPTSPSTC